MADDQWHNIHETTQVGNSLVVETRHSKRVEKCRHRHAASAVVRVCLPLRQPLSDGRHLLPLPHLPRPPRPLCSLLACVGLLIHEALPLQSPKDLSHRGTETDQRTVIKLNGSILPPPTPPTTFAADWLFPGLHRVARPYNSSMHSIDVAAASIPNSGQEPAILSKKPLPDVPSLVHLVDPSDIRQRLGTLLKRMNPEAVTTSTNGSQTHFNCP